MLGADPRKMPLVANLRRQASVVVPSLPSALNQNRPISTADILHYLAFMLLTGLVMYVGTLWCLWLFTRLFMRRSFRTLHEAATAVGVASALCLPTLYLAHAVVPERIWGVSEVTLIIVIAVAACTVVFRLLTRGDTSFMSDESSIGPK
jgi:hypothetical protein